MSLPEMIAQYNKSARTINVTILALCAVMKKKCIINFPQNLFNKKITDFVHLELQVRFNSLINSLVNEWNSIVSLEFLNKLELLIIKRKLQLEDNDLLPEKDCQEYEIGIEISTIIESLISIIDIVDFINSVSQQVVQVKHVNDATKILTDRLEKKIYFPIFL